MNRAPCYYLFAVAMITATAQGGPVEDRAAVERVYHRHRSGETRTFEEMAPLADIERLVAREAKKQRTLLELYGVTVTEAMVSEEVIRIDHSTRAPHVLAEIRAALDHDEKRFADAVARPIVVDRLLAEHFAKDSTVHGPIVEKIQARRQALLALSAEERVSRPATQVTFDLTDSESAETKPRPLVSSTPPPVKGTSASPNYSVEATMQVAQVLSPGGDEPAAKDAPRQPISRLDPEIQAVLKQTLQQPGDVTPVIETATHILFYVAIRRDENTLETQVLAEAKLSLDAWLDQPITLHAVSRP